MSILRRNASLTNELGETVPTEQNIGSIWASISPLTAKELVIAAANNLNTTDEIRCRYTTAFNDTDTLEFHGTRYEIDEMIDIERQHIEWQIMAHVVS
jgi:SPP1 family predicted phage head-tail adaptor